MPSRVPPPLVPIPPPARKSLLGGVSAPLGPPIRGGAAAGRAEGAFERGEGGHAHFTLRAQTLPPLPPSPQGRLGHLCARTRGMRGFTSPSLRPRAANTCIARNGAPLGQRSAAVMRGAACVANTDLCGRPAPARAGALSHGIPPPHTRMYDTFPCSPFLFGGAASAHSGQS